VLKKTLAVFFLTIFVNLLATEIRLLPPNKVYQYKKNILVDCLTNSDLIDKELTEYLNYGIVLTFTYFVNFYKEEPLIDPIISELVVYKRVYYDIWSERYYVETNYPRIQNKTFKTIKGLIKELQRLNRLKICKTEVISQDSKYYFKTRNTLKITQLYSLFHIIFNFLSIFKYKTTFLTSKSYSSAELL
jgi:Domain of unknown function (DUF4390)